jgi:cytochrome P450
VRRLSRFDDVAGAATDPARFSCRETNGYRRRTLNVLVGTDPPEHTRLRRIAARSLSARRLEPLLAPMRALVDAHVDSFIRRGGGDAVTTLAEPLATEVFALLLGVPAGGLAARRRGRGLGPKPRRAWRSFFSEAIEERRADPRADLISSLLEPGLDGDALSDDELLDFLGLLLAAGIDTSRDLISGLLAELADHPEQWTLLRANPELAAAAVEEGLRYTSPIRAMYRTATCDAAVAGSTIPRDSRVLLSFGLANRDGARWDVADRFDVARYADGLTRKNAHLAFGAGPHTCPGAWLARLLVQLVLRSFLAHDVCFERAGPGERRPSECFNSLVALPLHVRKESTWLTTQT